ncbi:hypothetical protein DPMN_049250 [Dreissena polymorpha]|uniref:Uncharacterized protein n=1 Tax=Dreissena polymorpha TaxID=45954 RepID=A0A9D4HKB8_DREPO|nr:hypothetical protein DPMN_049228 [Dreissena polymorpha]KAH3723462.1 hypothetical protein DPMN_049250 [Dreissena polymorpha]
MDTMCFTCLDKYVLKHARALGTFPCPTSGLGLPVPEGGTNTRARLAVPGGHVPCKVKMS